MADFIIVGSTALKHWLPNSKEPKDLDIFYPEGNQRPDIKSNRKVEMHEIPKDIYDLFETDDGYLTLQSLYILKLSHAEYNIKWYKTLRHMMQLKAHTMPFDSFTKREKQLFEKLKNFWRIKHGYRKEKVTLNKTKDRFFTSKVKRIYDHDYIHDIVCYYHKPLYKRCLREGKEVLFDKSKFDALSFEDKIRLCREEIYVLALERYLIPVNFKQDANEAYRLALKCLVTRMSKGWFPTFIVDNYHILYKVDKDYSGIFRNAIK